MHDVTEIGTAPPTSEAYIEFKTAFDIYQGIVRRNQPFMHPPIYERAREGTKIGHHVASNLAMLHENARLRTTVDASTEDRLLDESHALRDENDQLMDRLSQLYDELELQIRLRVTAKFEMGLNRLLAWWNGRNKRTTPDVDQTDPS